MDHVLTLVAGAGGLDDRLLAEIRRALGALGADTVAPCWLAEGRAADLAFAWLAPCQAEAAARKVLDGAPVDVAAQDLAHRRKRLLVADMDSTILTGETLDELAEFAGLKARVAEITALAMNGEIDFQSAFRERVALLAGLPVDALAKTCERMELTAGARTLVATMKAHGAFTALVSSGFCYFTQRVGEYCGFDRAVGNAIEIKEGHLTGAVIEPVLDGQGKLKTLIGLAAERQVPLPHSLAVGDGANDLDMLGAAGLGIAFHARPAVAAGARARIDHADLTALLFIQGYREDEFVVG